MSWDFDKKDIGAKINYTKFPVGITKVRFLSDAPHQKWAHYIAKEKRTINCPGKGCPICEIRQKQKANDEAYTYPMSRRMSMYLFNYDTNQYEVCEQGSNFYKELRDLKDEIEKGGNMLHDAIIKVKRRGSAKDDTSYRLDIDRVDGLQDEMKKGFTELTALSELSKPHTIEQITNVVQGMPWDEVMGYDKKDEDKPADADEAFGLE